MTNNKQQTAVEWLIEQFWNNEGMLSTKKLEKAKEMEKEQIMDAYDAGWSDGNDDKDLNDEYYFETYEKD